MSSVLEAVGEIISHKAIFEIVNFEPGGSSRFEKPGEANTVLGKAANLLGTKASNLVNNSTLLNGPKSALGIETRTINDGVIQVQYNPASIRYDAGTPTPTGNTATKVENPASGSVRVISPGVKTSYINMSFTLVFHSKYTTDLSVKEQMELIMNMIYDNPGREVKFSWANMVAQGRLVAFSGEYDMFDMTGNPTSGKMDMTIRMDVSETETSKMIEEGQKERSDKEA